MQKWILPNLAIAILFNPIAPITIAGEKYACEVVVKQGKERQGFYLHKVELKKKLTDVFKTANGSTSMSSKSIIADLVNKYNSDVKKHEERNILFQSKEQNNLIAGYTPLEVMTKRKNYPRLLQHLRIQ